MTDLRTLRICVRAITTAVTGIVGDCLAAFRPPLTPVSVLGGTWPCGGIDECYCGTDKDVRPEFAQPLGEVPDLPPIVPATAANHGAAPVPGGVPRAAGDQPTSVLLDELAKCIAWLANRTGHYSDALDDLITAGYERAEQIRSGDVDPE